MATPLKAEKQRPVPAQPPNQLFLRKPLKMLLAEARDENRLRRCLGPVQLTSLGVGAIIGAGIFVATGAAARNTAGPALMLSYCIAGMTCVFAALCYAEFASMVPVAGSAYTYAFATLGELFAWIIGWDLVLEYAVGSATVANGWSGYFQSLLPKIGMELPAALAGPPIIYDEALGRFVATQGIINLPAVIIVAIVTFVLVKGIQESASFNATMVGVKLAAVLFVIMVGAFYVNPANWHPFAPYGWTGLNVFGFHVAGQADAGGQPIGIVASLLICTVLYIAVVAVLTGMVSYTRIDPNAGVSSAFKEVGLGWAEVIISIAGVAGITSVLLVMMLSGPRVFLAMARDGLVPRGFFAEVHPRFRTPWKSTILIGAFVATMAGFLPLGALLHLTNIGTLLAFVIVCVAVLIMRKMHPEAERPFRCPWVPVVPILGILFCLMLMFSLPAANWWRLGLWLAAGLVIYFLYGKRHSVVAREAGRYS